MLGDPVEHSLSPVLHRAAYDALGLDWTYDAVRVEEGGLAELLAHLGDDVRGLSLTMPLKREVLGLAHDVTERAVLAGAANTLVVEEGHLLADNTDLPGVAAALRERSDAPVRRAVLLGAGATAASAGLALADLGAETLVVLARSAARAEQTRRVLARHRSHPEVVVADLDTADVAGDVLFSSIPAAAQGPELLARCAQVPVVFEALYDPWPTPLAASAAADGRAVVGGLDLLVHQAVLQVELFCQAPGPLPVMRAAGEAALAARTRHARHAPHAPHAPRVPHVQPPARPRR